VIDGESRVFRNGRIWTGRRFVEALLIEDGRVVAGGSAAEIGRSTPTGAARSELEGRLVLPGLVDPHLHLTGLARRRAGVELGEARSFEEVGERLRAWTEANPGGAVWGGGLNDERLVERRLPTRRDLDRWVPDRPTVLMRACEHVAVLNSAGLAAIEVTERTADPPGGSIAREPDGSPEGALRETALSRLEFFPAPSLEDRPELGDRVLEEIARAGLTAIASLRAEPEELAWATQRLRERGGPRYFAFGRVDVPEEIAQWGWTRRHDPLHLLGVKLMADGSLGARTAWLERPYADAPDGSGAPAFPAERWEEAFRAADAEGLRVAAHAIGDRALARVVAAIAAVRPAQRPRIEHASLVPEGLERRLVEAGPDLVVQPGFRRSDPWVEARVGPERASTAYPFARLGATGLALAGSSDAPIEPLDPFDGIRCAVAPVGPGAPLGLREALALYTSGGAAVLGQPDLGHLEPGATASLLVLEATELEAVAGPASPALRESWIDGRRAF
jgi:predicted amidohydrolase YtcJ